MAEANRNLQPLTEQLVTEAREQLIPAAALGDFPAFAASLGRYCETAGKFYADVQGGPYNGPAVAALAESIRGLGHVGLGQSSWGPTLFVACPDEAAANELARQLRCQHSRDLVEMVVAAVRNSPAEIALTGAGTGS
jgi:predicted sugar kinase